MVKTTTTTILATTCRKLQSLKFFSERLFRPSALREFLIFLSLLCLTLWFLLVHFLNDPVCSSLDSTHEQMKSTLLQLDSISRPYTTLRFIKSDDIKLLQPLLLQLRQYADSYQRQQGKGEEKQRKCIRNYQRRQQTQQFQRHELEFSVLCTSQYGIDGVLLYIMSIAGTTRKSMVEIDNTSGVKGIIRSGALVSLLYNWTLYGMYQTWSGYESARKFYTSSLSTLKHITIIDTGQQINLQNIAEQHGFGGHVDLASLYTNDGSELTILSSFKENKHGTSAWIRPRFIFMFYEDYWGATVDKIRIDTNSTSNINADFTRTLMTKRIYAGGSILAIVNIARRVHYRLIWCMGSAPIAIFIDVTQSNNNHDDVFPTLNTKQCVHSRLHFKPEWKLDAEAMWDEAQNYVWKTSKQLTDFQ